MPLQQCNKFLSKRCKLLQSTRNNEPRYITKFQWKFHGNTPILWKYSCSLISQFLKFFDEPIISLVHCVQLSILLVSIEYQFVQCHLLVLHSSSFPLCSLQERDPNGTLCLGCVVYWRRVKRSPTVTKCTLALHYCSLPQSLVLFFMYVLLLLFRNQKIISLYWLCGPLQWQSN